MHEELYHHGIRGMKWGVRRYQNKDGSLTPAGKKRYSELINPDGSYTQKAIREGFERKVEKGVINYIHGRKINDPIVQEVINRNKHEIERQVTAARHRQIQSQIINQQAMAGAEFANQQAIAGAEFARQQAEMASRQAASLGISGGVNPFLFG